jgi:hypothetical protein
MDIKKSKEQALRTSIAIKNKIISSITIFLSDEYNQEWELR